VELHTWLTLDEWKQQAFLCQKGMDEPNTTSIYIDLPYKIVERIMSKSWYKGTYTTYSEVDFTPDGIPMMRSIYDLKFAVFQIEVTIKGILEKSKVTPYLYQLSDIHHITTEVCHHKDTIDFFPTDTYKLEVYMKPISKDKYDSTKDYQVIQRLIFLVGSGEYLLNNLSLVDNIHDVHLNHMNNIAGVLGDILPSKDNKQNKEHLSLKVRANTKYRDEFIWLVPQPYFKSFKAIYGIFSLGTANVEIIGRITPRNPDSPNPIALSRNPKWKLDDIQQITLLREFEVKVE
ncbi:MAG: hypothetical protein AAF846_24665, partial [Chloroflexota bacterium]